MVSFSRRDLSKPDWVLDLEESVWSSPATSVQCISICSSRIEDGEEGNILSAAVVTFSVALSRVDLEESG